MESEKRTSGGDKYSKLAGNTIIFAISSFSSKLLTLLVQPFLTYAMAEIADLGLAKILSQYANLLIPFVSMGMSNAIIRFGLTKGCQHTLNKSAVFFCIRTSCQIKRSSLIEIGAVFQHPHAAL